MARVTCKKQSWRQSSPHTSWREQKKKRSLSIKVWRENRCGPPEGCTSRVWVKECPGGQPVRQGEGFEIICHSGGLLTLENIVELVKEVGKENQLTLMSYKTVPVIHLAGFVSLWRVLCLCFLLCWFLCGHTKWSMNADSHPGLPAGPFQLQLSPGRQVRWS